MKIINIVDSVESINAGVWKASISTNNYLKQLGIQQELWYPKGREVFGEEIITESLMQVSLGKLKELLVSKNLDPSTDIIVTHGSWRYPTRWAAFLREKGFVWIYTPQGMLEPWPMKHKRWKKIAYFSLIEERLATKANIIRAVSKPEQQRLKILFPHNKVVWIPNGVNCSASYQVEKSISPIRFVFMARLQVKKGIIPLVSGWLKSSLNNNPDFILEIAGPDEGELRVMLDMTKNSSNIKYVGVVSGAVKDKLLAEAHYYLLPSFSEGLPTSVLEAMEKGAIPVISEGCNFNEVIENGLGYTIEPDINNIKESLEQLAYIKDGRVLSAKGVACHNFIKSNYSLDRIAGMQSQLYHNLLNGNKD